MCPILPLFFAKRTHNDARAAVASAAASTAASSPSPEPALKHAVPVITRSPLCAPVRRARRAAGGREEVFEDELLDALREKGLITYPSLLLAPLLEGLPKLFEEEILKQRLDPTDRALFSRASRACKAAVASSGGLGIAGDTAEERFKVLDSVRSVELLGFARAGVRGRRGLLHMRNRQSPSQEILGVVSLVLVNDFLATPPYRPLNSVSPARGAGNRIDQ